MDNKAMGFISAAGCLVFTAAGVLAALTLANFIDGGLAVIICLVVFAGGFYLFFYALYEKGVKTRQAYYVETNDNALKFKLATGLFDAVDEAQEAGPEEEPGAVPPADGQAENETEA